MLLLCCLAVGAQPLLPERIAALEASRQPYGAELKAYLEHPDPEVRARAARAAGRLQDPTAVPDLAALLRDPYPEVRGEVAFALGQIPGRASEKILLSAMLRTDLDPELRARLIEAAVKVGQEQTLSRLDDWLEADRQESEVLRAAALGAGQYVMRRGRWEPALPALPERIVARTRKLLTHPDPEVVAAALYALYRAEDRVASAEVARLLDSPEPEVVRSAARCLAVTATPEARPAILRALGSRDWIVRLNLGRALALLGEVGPLRALLADPHPSVRRGVAMAVGKLGPAALPLAGELARLGEDPEADVAEASVEALGLVGRESVLDSTRAAARSSRWRVRRGATRALVARLPATRAEVLSLTADPAVGVAAEALAGLKADRSPEAEEAVRRALAGGDLALVAAAAETLAAWKDPAWAPLLVETYRRSQDSEVQQALLEALGPLGNREAIPVLEEAAQGPDANLARVARKSLALFREVEPVNGELPGSGPTPVAASLPDDCEQDSAILVTERGPIRLRLLGKQAPGTVRNFVSLARKGYYDGLTFHRVVPDFVTQGGDPRGDGWGGPGYTIRCEINPIPYERGTVGMALAGKDTGGSQFFICHSPQPHLDGRYTVWAQVEDGMSVVDLLQEGDRILRVELP